MEKIDYSQVYALQDQVLKMYSSFENTFYLTGGTCIHRFYTEKRYSKDLDLFTNDNALYRDEVRIVKDMFASSGLTTTIQVDTRDFVRIIVQSFLQIDLVNDRVYRHGHSVITEQGYRIDNLFNITANKITSIIGRDEPKDIFDIYTIARHSIFNWGEIVDIANKKAIIDKELLEYRFKSFPHELLDDLVIKDREFLKQLKQDYSILVEDILNEMENRLSHKGS